MWEILIVALGGGIGAVSRYLTSNWAIARLGTDFPYGTLIVNIVGCFIIGLFMALAVDRLNISPYWRLFVTVGFLGGLTTFSSFSYETLNLLENSMLLPAFYNIGLNLFGGLGAAWLGVGLVKFIS